MCNKYLLCLKHSYLSMLTNAHVVCDYDVPVAEMHLSLQEGILSSYGYIHLLHQQLQ